MLLNLLKFCLLHIQPVQFLLTCFQLFQQVFVKMLQLLIFLLFIWGLQRTLKIFTHKTEQITEGCMGISTGLHQQIGNFHHRQANDLANCELRATHSSVRNSNSEPLQISPYGKWNLIRLWLYTFPWCFKSPEKVACSKFRAWKATMPCVYLGTNRRLRSSRTTSCASMSQILPQLVLLANV